MVKALMEKNRIEAFSDGVIAIIITLLVLEIKVPHIEGEITTAVIWSSLQSIAPKFLSWGMSFFMVLIMWVNHHRIFNDIKQSNNGLLWLNGMLLFFMSFVPFPTALIGDYFSSPASVSFFGICLAMMGLSFAGLRYYLVRNPELLKEGISIESYKALAGKSLLSPVLYFTGAAVAFASVYVSYVIYLIVPLYFVFFGSKK